MAAEVLCSRWTVLVLRELLSGTTRFNDLRRGVPLMSPTLLSKRLKELIDAGVVTTIRTAQPGIVEYKVTEAGEELRGIVMSLGVWGQRWIESSMSMRNLDPALLMWDMRRRVSTASFPNRKCTVKFIYPELRTNRNSWWIVVDDGAVDLCSVDPGYEIDLYVRATLRNMIMVWMGISTLKAEIEAGKIELTGDKALARSMHNWLGLSAFAGERSRGTSSS
jgi:DNA-binding HxlR family transcriptional regulator